MPVALTYTLLGLCAAALLFALWLDGERGGRRFPRLRRIGLLLQLGAVVGAYFVLRPGAGTDGRVAVEQSVATGQPVLLDIYSNW
jgi:hypothetical protein